MSRHPYELGRHHHLEQGRFMHRCELCSWKYFTSNKDAKYCNRCVGKVEEKEKEKDIRKKKRN